MQKLKKMKEGVQPKKFHSLVLNQNQELFFNTTIVNTKDILVKKKEIRFKNKDTMK